jgi:hypothetical protein
MNLNKNNKKGEYKIKDKMTKKVYNFLKYHLANKISDIYYSLKNGPKHVFEWLPVVWNDRHWDQYYIYKILRHKLYLQEKFIRHRGCHVNNERDADQIKRCIMILDRLLEDNYIMNATKYHDKKWGENEWIFTPIEGDEELSKLDIVYENAKTQKEKDQQHKEYMRCNTHSRNMREQDLDYLFKYMRKHIEGWWD